MRVYAGRPADAVAADLPHPDSATTSAHPATTRRIICLTIPDGRRGGLWGALRPRGAVEVLQQPSGRLVPAGVPVLGVAAAVIGREPSRRPGREVGEDLPGAAEDPAVLRDQDRDLVGAGHLAHAV